MSQSIDIDLTTNDNEQQYTIGYRTSGDVFIPIEPEHQSKVWRYYERLCQRGMRKTKHPTMTTNINVKVEKSKNNVDTTDEEDTAPRKLQSFNQKRPSKRQYRLVSSDEEDEAPRKLQSTARKKRKLQKKTNITKKTHMIEIYSTSEDEIENNQYKDDDTIIGTFVYKYLLYNSSDIIT